MKPNKSGKHRFIDPRQMDLFAAAFQVAVESQEQARDFLNDPKGWSEEVRDQMVNGMLLFAVDTVDGTVPAILMDCAKMLADRLNKRKLDLDDYFATIGWIVGDWNGGLPYRFVCKVSGVDPDILKGVVYESPLLHRDLIELQHPRSKIHRQFYQ